MYGGHHPGGASAGGRAGGRATAEAGDSSGSSSQAPAVLHRAHSICHLAVSGRPVATPPRTLSSPVLLHSLRAHPPLAAGLRAAAAVAGGRRAVRPARLLLPPGCPAGARGPAPSRAQGRGPSRHHSYYVPRHSPSHPSQLASTWMPLPPLHPAPTAPTAPTHPPSHPQGQLDGTPYSPPGDYTDVAMRDVWRGRKVRAQWVGRGPQGAGGRVGGRRSSGGHGRCGAGGALRMTLVHACTSPRCCLACRRRGCSGATAHWAAGVTPRKAPSGRSCWRRGEHAALCCAQRAGRARSRQPRGTWLPAACTASLHTVGLPREHISATALHLQLWSNPPPGLPQCECARFKHALTRGRLFRDHCPPSPLFGVQPRGDPGRRCCALPPVLAPHSHAHPVPSCCSYAGSLG